MAGQARRVVAELRQAIGKVVGGLMIEIHANVTEDTPRDTGWAASNWLANIGAPPVSVITPTSRQARASGVSGRAAASSGSLAPLITYVVGRGRIYVSNAVPYILGLNQGTSQKAPAGFVQTGIIRAVNKFLRAA